MKLLVLAAGYAVRLHPLTLNQPKPLLEVAGKPMMEYVLSSLLPIQEIDEVFVVTNARFAQHFETWAATYSPERPVKITIVNDHTTDESNKLGAIGDLHFVISHHAVGDDLIVVAGDNLFDVKLDRFGAFVAGRLDPVLGVYDVKELEPVKKYSEARVDESGRLTSFIEKPPIPTSTLIGIALYYYPKATLPRIQEYISGKNNPDQPGRLIQWLLERMPISTWTVPGLWHDIGSKETLAEADAIFRSQKPA
jgi:glucose-1-phosphate thymidylyltransferase